MSCLGYDIAPHNIVLHRNIGVRWATFKRAKRAFRFPAREHLIA
jgi:hypothetical protein